MIFSVGRVCVKLAGRDAGKYCVVIKNVDSNSVLIDGQTRRRNCNISHLEPLDVIVDIAENSSNSDVAKALSQANFQTEERKASSKKVSQRPTKKRIVVEKIADKVIQK